MATLVLTDAYLMLDTTSYAGLVKSITLNYSADMLEDTAMGDNTHSKKGGLKNWDADIEFYQDYSTGTGTNIDTTLWGLIGSSFALAIRPTTVVKWEGNPEYQGVAIGESYSPVKGSVGEMAMTSFRCVAVGDLVRAATSS